MTIITSGREFPDVVSKPFGLADVELSRLRITRLRVSSNEYKKGVQVASGKDCSDHAKHGLSHSFCNHTGAALATAITEVIGDRWMTELSWLGELYVRPEEPCPKTLETQPKASAPEGAALSPLAGKPAPREMLIDVARLEKEYSSASPT
jgi:hypothetical protein